ncbi:MAG: phytanoyl-CoA dioxygenase family protein, partial [Actinomycetota bacterium]
MAGDVRSDACADVRSDLRDRDLGAARNELNRAGQVTLRGLLTTDEIGEFRAILDRALPAAQKVELPPEFEVYRRAFDQYMNLWRVDDAVRAITLHSELAAVAAELLGVEAVRLYHDQALVKRAGGGRTPWHQDQWYWPLDTDRTITMWLPLDTVGPDMGELEFALGSHRGPIGDVPISGESDVWYERHLSEHNHDRRTTGEMWAGDASFHLGWTLHRAEPNVTDRDRVVMTVIWFADGARVT